MERLISKENKKMNIWNIKKNHYQLHVFEDCVEVFVKQFLGCFKMKKKKKLKQKIDVGNQSSFTAHVSKIALLGVLFFIKSNKYKYVLSILGLFHAEYTCKMLKSLKRDILI